MQIDAKTTLIKQAKKPRIGFEFECYIIHSNNLKEVSRSDVAKIFKRLKDEGWTVGSSFRGEVHEVVKKYNKTTASISLDLSYPIFEIKPMAPLNSIIELEQFIVKVFREFRGVLFALGFEIWHFGIPPASSNLYNLDFKTSENLVRDRFYELRISYEEHARFHHMVSHQISIDVSYDKIIPLINSLYKNLGYVVNKYANSPLRIADKFYKEGRYYYWQEYSKTSSNPRFKDVLPGFPEKPFESIDQYYRKSWESPYFFLLRSGRFLLPHNKMQSIGDFIRRGECEVIKNDKIIIAKLEKSDLVIFLKMLWPDFKLHFNLKQNYTIEEFKKYYKAFDLDAFFAKYAASSYIEIRPCSPRYENNSMDIPKYFYSIFLKPDVFIEQMKYKHWEEAKVEFEQALF